ncbi:hypothetical protein TcCL_NonESM07343 [Trypanosoma cruzi]|nr:hypothetical protein TcCL_NonESM07343 [Trypanosoma cruzi]
MVRRPSCVQQSVICIFVSAKLAGAARRCRRPLIIGTLRLFFLSAQREKQLFLQAICWSASMLPTWCHAAVPLQCHSHCGFIFTNWLFLQCNACFPHCTSGPLSFFFFARPLPAAPNWEAARFLNTLHLFMLLGVLGSNGCGDVDVVLCFEWWRCVPLLLSFCRRCLLHFLDRHARKESKQTSANRYCEFRRH